jgi:hypothetical protein
MGAGTGLKILLVDPAGAQRYVSHNAGLAFLSSSLLARGHEVRVLDMNNYRYTNEDAAAYARNYGPDWVTCRVWSQSLGRWPMARERPGIHLGSRQSALSHLSHLGSHRSIRVPIFDGPQPGLSLPLHVLQRTENQRQEIPQTLS